MGEVGLVAKMCTKCKQVKSLDKFYRDKNRQDKHTSQCKACIYTPRKPKSRDDVFIFIDEQSNRIDRREKWLSGVLRDVVYREVKAIAEARWSITDAWVEAEFSYIAGMGTTTIKIECNERSYLRLGLTIKVSHLMGYKIDLHDGRWWLVAPKVETIKQAVEVIKQGVYKLL